MIENLEKVLDEIRENKRLREEGKYIGLPVPFPRMRKLFPYITRGRYVIVTANSKVGKTQITDFMFLYWVFIFQRELQTNFKFKIIYFSLEMSKEDKIRSAISFFLWYYKGIRMSPDRISSQYDDYILEDHMLKEVEEIMPIVNEFLEMVEFVDEIRHPTGISKYLTDFAEKRGTWTKKEIDWQDPDTKEYSKREVKDQFIYNDPDEFWIAIVDHMSLISPEKDQSLHLAMSDLSAKKFITLRNRLNFLLVGVQQQAQQQESVENVKLNMLKPSHTGLGDNKTTGRDCDLMFGLFAPNRYNIKTHEGYDITRLRDNYREFLTIFNRRGSCVSTDLYFDGDVNFFKELPAWESMSEAVYERVTRNEVDSKLI